MAKSKKKEPLTFEQMKATFDEFQDDSDRAAAILSVALLDTQLGEILTAFSADEQCTAELLEPEHPLGALSARRRLCLSLGLISPDEAAELALLGKIRNEFAHKLHGQSFSTEPIVGWVQSLIVPARVYKGAKFENRARFMSSVALVHLLLVWRLDAAKEAKRKSVLQADIHLQPMSKEDFDHMAT